MKMSSCWKPSAALVFLLLLSGCETRSISNSGYQASRNPFYKGELSAYDVLGVDQAGGFSDADIRKAMVDRHPIRITKGSAIMLIQSGAIMADPDMVAALERYYTVSSFSGVPLEDKRPIPGQSAPVAPYAQLFRMAAAKGGYDTIVVYWGIVESASQGLGGKAVSWMPIIGGVIPDETERMRIRLLVAVIDVRTGQWESFSPEPAEDEAVSNQHGRAASDQRQVALLKAKTYKEAADAVAVRFGR